MQNSQSIGRSPASAPAIIDTRPPGSEARSFGGTAMLTICVLVPSIFGASPVRHARLRKLS